MCEEEIKFALEALEFNQSIAFIRSRCDVLLTNELKKKNIIQIDQGAVDRCLTECEKIYANFILKKLIFSKTKLQIGDRKNE